MIKNSLLEAYKKYGEIINEMVDSGCRSKLEQRLDACEKLEMKEEYLKTTQMLQELARIEYDLDHAFFAAHQSDFDAPKHKWQNYFRKADQMLYGVPIPEEFVGSGCEEYYNSNEILLEKVVTELNNKFPGENWKLGEIPYYYWRQLNYPGYELSEYCVESWERDPNVTHNEFGWFEHSAKFIKSIYPQMVGEALEEAKDDLDALADITDAVRKDRGAYIVDYNAVGDGECSGGYNLTLDVVFEDGATTSFYDTKFTPWEQVMNDTIVKEIDERCAGLSEMKLIHNRLDSISKKLKDFLAKYNLKPTTQKASPSESGMGE